MTTPPPVYESPRWLPPPIASTEEEGAGWSVKLSDDGPGCAVLYSGRERARTQTPLPSGATPLAV